MTDLAFGIDEDGKPVSFDPAALHTVLAGRTRSGKSTTAYRILSEASEQSWVRIVGLDPTGVLLGPLASGKPLDFALGTSPGALCGGIELLQRVEAEMDRRIGKLMPFGVDQIPASAYSDPRLGAILLVLEEYPGLLAAMTRGQADETRRIISRLHQEGSKSAIHVMTIVQRPTAEALRDRAQLGRAVLMAVENADSVRMLASSASPEQVERLIGAPPGRGLVAEVGRPLRFFRSDYMTYTQYVASVQASSTRKAPLFGGKHRVAMRGSAESIESIRGRRQP